MSWMRFIASIAVITPDPSVSRRLYVDALGLPLAASDDDDYCIVKTSVVASTLHALVVDCARVRMREALSGVPNFGPARLSLRGSPADNEPPWCRACVRIVAA
jgi:catechol 2,3-dioxygenase-like lactoylglutathione lyase family enzyme